MKLQFGKTINVIILSKMQRGERGGEQAGEGSRRGRGAGGGGEQARELDIIQLK